MTGTISAARIVRQRRVAAVTYDDLKRMGVVLKRAKYFITVGGRYYGGGVQQEDLREHLILQSGGQQQIEEELGDLLFSCVNTARHLHVDAETALRGAAEKFRRRFAETERLVTADGKDMASLDMEALHRYWDIAKQTSR